MQIIRFLLATLFLCVLSYDQSLVAQPKNGKHTTYFDSGEIFETGNYRKSKREGEWKQYDKDGKLRKRTTYSKGVRQGPELSYSIYGTQIAEANWYLNDTLHGLRYVYDARGDLDSILQYRHGKKNGWQRIYGTSDKFRLRKKQFMRNDTLLCERRYEQGGQLHAIEYYKDGLLDGECRYYRLVVLGKDTSAWQTIMYRKGVRDGEEKTFYPQGSGLSTITTYQNGERNGKFYSYMQDGSLYNETDYVNDQRHGEDRFYYNYNGKKKQVVKRYAFNKQEGLQLEINHKSDTILKSWYHAGLFDSSRTYAYGENGKLFLETKISLVKHAENGSYYLRKYWKSENILLYEAGMFSKVQGSESRMQPFGKATGYHPDGKKHSETWWNLSGPDSLYRSWYLNGKQEFTCKIKSGALALAPEIWSEQGVKLKPGTKPYNTIFSEKVVPAVRIDPRIYDPEKDGIVYTPGQPSVEAYDRIVEGDIDEAFSLDDKVYEVADEPAMYGSTPEGFDEYMLSLIRPELFWMEKLPLNDSIVISFVVGPYMKNTPVVKEHVAKSQEKLASEIEAAASKTSWWNSARIKQREVKYRVRYALRFAQLYRWMSGAELK